MSQVGNTVWDIEMYAGRGEVYLRYIIIYIENIMKYIIDK